MLFLFTLFTRARSEDQQIIPTPSLSRRLARNSVILDITGHLLFPQTRVVCLHAMGGPCLRKEVLFLHKQEDCIVTIVKFPPVAQMEQLLLNRLMSLIKAQVFNLCDPQVPH